jgi:hypothetical protein
MVKNLSWIILFLVITATSCSPLITPTTYQVPNLKEKGDAQLDFEGGAAIFNAQLAYSPIQNIAFTATENFNNFSLPDAHTANHTTFGAGYYSTNNSKLQQSVYLKFGYGSATDRAYSDNEHTIDTRYITNVGYIDIQLQPQLNWIKGTYESYVGLRMSLIHTNSFSSNDVNRISPGNAAIFEPFFGARKGFDNLKFDLQLGLYAHKNTHQSTGLNANSFTSDGVVNINFGIAYMFNIHKKHFGVNN